MSLADGPLAQAGLFAITGPTGAGKSTLLDAMCLALYGRVPRVKGERGGYRVPDDADASEEDGLTITDVRHIVRRGAAEAFAEVDFVGYDNRCWRARWSVRRARGKATGKFQDVKSEFFDLTKGESKTEHQKEATRALIANEVGLTYEQFCRSVLLAQGDFAAFLKASADERAQILEALTNTQLYADLSKAAHEREKSEKAKLAALEAEAGGLQLLSDDERAAAQAEKEAREEQRRRLTDERQTYEAARQWCARRDTLERDLREAKAAHQAAVEARQEADGDAAYLARIEQAEGLRHLSERCLRAREAYDEAAAQQAAAVERLSAAGEAFAEAQSQAQEAEEQLRAIQAEREAKQPEFEQARALDVRLAEAAKRHAEVERRCEEAARRERDAHAKLEEAVLERAEVDEAIGRANQWLAAQGHLETLVRQSSLWERDIQAYAAASREIVRLSDEEAQLGEAIGTLTDALEQARQIVREANVQLEAATAALSSATQVFEALQAVRSPAARQETRRQLEEQQKRLERLKRLWEEAVQAEADRAAAERDVRAAQNALARLKQQHAELTGGRRALEAERNAREQELRLAQATEELAARRPDLLFPGKPCPLCGSTEHPDADQPAPPSELVARLKSELDAAQQALAARDAELRQVEKHIAAEETSAKAGQERLAAAEARRQSQCVQWETLRPSGFPASPLDPRAQASLEAAFGRLTAEKAKLDEDENAYEAARSERDAAQDRVNQLSAQAQSAQEALQRLEAEKQRLEGDWRLCRTRRESQTAQREQALQALEPAFAWEAEWRVKLDADADAFFEWAQALVKAWEATEQSRQAALTRRSDIERDIAGRQSAYHAAQTTREQAEDERAAVAAELEQHRRSRAALLDGKPTAEVVKALDDALHETDRRLDDARQKLTEAASRKVAAETALKAAEAQCAIAAQEAADARMALDAALAAAGLDVEELNALLSVPVAERQALKARIEALDHACVAAKGALESKQRELDAHLASNPLTMLHADVESRLAELDVQIAEANKAIGALAERLRQDDELRRRALDLAEKIKAQRATYEVWAKLNDVIGSADGKKFRLFAQSLRFQTLLDHANHYLQQLRQRYRLAPVRGAELELQVIDHAMADAVRPITTLSGGETFLISLALALGLSAMSANRVVVESLFIDEGFGTLDSQSLEVALGMLDQLQATGRQIGVISHIPELTERIGYRVEVRPNGRGASQVFIIGG